MIKHLYLLILLLGLVSCNKEEAPTPQGELLTDEQVLNLPKNDSLNMKQVSVEGYYSLPCSKGIIQIPKSFKLGSVVDLVIRTKPDCEGKELITAQIQLRGGEVKGLTPPQIKPRNYILGKVGDFDPHTLTIRTDDYKDVEYQKLRFSGTLIFDTDHYYLTKVSIHSIN